MSAWTRIALFTVLAVVLLLVGCEFIQDTGDWLAGNEQTIDDVTGVVEDVAPMIPSPFGQIAMIALGIFGYVRAALVKYAAKQAIRSVDPIVSQATAAALATVADKQGSMAKSLVDQAQGKTWSSPI